MTVLWNSNQNGQSYPNPGNDRDPFQEPHEGMIAFWAAHPKNWKQWSQNGSGEQVGLLESLLALTPMREVALATYSPN